MTNFRCYFPALLFGMLLFLPRAAQAAESYDNCAGFITSLPAVISGQGVWCVKQHLTTSIAAGNAITINANNVTLDCNNFNLDGSGAGLATQAVGIYANGRANVVVRHCRVRGFYKGLAFLGTGGGHLIEDNSFEGSTYNGLTVQTGSVVRRNRVLDTGKSTVTTAPIGIYASQSTDVLDNTVSGVTATAASNSNAVGIFTSGDIDNSIAGNRVRAIAKDGTGNAYAIQNVSSGRVILRNNDLTGDSSTGSVGLACSSGSGSARGNVIHDFATPISTCADAGGNFHIP